MVEKCILNFKLDFMFAGCTSPRNHLGIPRILLGKTQICSKQFKLQIETWSSSTSRDSKFQVFAFGPFFCSWHSKQAVLPEEFENIIFVPSKFIYLDRVLD